MQKLKIARARVEDYLPFTPAAIQLQYLYIVKNPNPPDHRDDLVNAQDGSEYSRVHRNTITLSKPSSRSLATTIST